MARAGRGVRFYELEKSFDFARLLDAKWRERNCI